MSEISSKIQMSCVYNKKQMLAVGLAKIIIKPHKIFILTSVDQPCSKKIFSLRLCPDHVNMKFYTYLSFNKFHFQSIESLESLMPLFQVPHLHLNNFITIILCITEQITKSPSKNTSPKKRIHMKSLGLKSFRNSGLFLTEKKRLFNI